MCYTPNNLPEISKSELQSEPIDHVNETNYVSRGNEKNIRERSVNVEIKTLGRLYR